MNKNLTFDFLVDKTNKTITVVREFDAEVALVWNAFAKKELLDQWWAPKPWKIKTKKMDFKVGGQWFYVMVGPRGNSHWITTEYTTIKPGKKIVSLDAFTDAEGKIKELMPHK